MIDQQAVDLVGLIPTVLKKTGREFHGPCPFCGGKDRFVVKPEGNTWWCRQCNRRGDPMEFLVQHDGITPKEAFERLGLKATGGAGSKKSETSKRSALPQPPVHAGDQKEAECFTLAWQRGAYTFTCAAAESLISQWGKCKASAYLESRGIDRETAEFHGLGQNIETHNQTWGETNVWLPRGIVIPWEFQWEMWNVRVRRPQPDIENGGDKYMSAKGAGNGLYLARAVTPGQPVVMVEGEFDAIIIEKCTRSMPGIGVVSISSNTGSRLLRWVTYLALASQVILAFDDDPAGENAAAYWSKALPTTTRLRPSGGKDATEMYQNNRGVLQWVMGALAPSEAMR